ncbi:MAG: ABC transporter substrate-binding protein [Mycobacteriales bacterium]
MRALRGCGTLLSTPLPTRGYAVTQARISQRAIALAFSTLLLAGACAKSDDNPTLSPPSGSTSPTAESLFAKLPARIQASKLVKVASDAAYPPIESVEGGKIVGLDPDIADALGKKLGVSFVFTATGFDGIIPALKAQRFDVVMSAMTDNADRRKQIDFVDYFSAGTAIIVKKGNPQGIKSLDDLCGKTIAVQKGTVQVDIATKQQAKCGSNKIVIKTFPKDTDALLQVRNGRAVADMNDLPVAVYTATTSGGGNDFEVVAGQQYEAGPYGIGVRKDDTQLRDAIQAALKAIIDDGSYDQILAKWNVTSGALKDASINGGS